MQQAMRSKLLIILYLHQIIPSENKLVELWKTPVDKIRTGFPLFPSKIAV